MSWRGNKMLSYWYALSSKPTVSETAIEPAVAALGQPYRAQHLFMGLHHVADFVLLTDKVVIEVDGDSHDRPAQKEKDLVHSQALQTLGYVVTRVTNALALRDPVGAVESALRQAQALRATPPDYQAALDRLHRDYPALLAAAAKKATRRKPPAPKVAKVRRSRATPRPAR